MKHLKDMNIHKARSRYLLSRDDGSVGNQGKVDPGVRHQIGLELVQVHVESSIKSEGCSDGGDDLRDQPVEVGVGRSLNVQVPDKKTSMKD